MQEGAALPDELLNRGIESGGSAAVPGDTQDIVNPAVFPVALLVKGHGGLNLNAVFRGLNPVEHGGDIPMVPEIVRASAVDRHRRDSGNTLGRGVLVGNPDLQKEVSSAWRP